MTELLDEPNRLYTTIGTDYIDPITEDPDVVQRIHDFTYKSSDQLRIILQESSSDADYLAIQEILMQRGEATEF